MTRVVAALAALVAAWFCIPQPSVASSHRFPPRPTSTTATTRDLADNLGYVDGHDVGSGEMNIFIHTDFPREAFQAVQTLLISNPMRIDLCAAFRPSDGDQYTALWPEGLQEFSAS